MTSSGPIVAYRNRSDDEIRTSMSRVVSATMDDGNCATTTLEIAACPVNGPPWRARQSRGAGLVHGTG